MQAAHRELLSDAARDALGIPVTVTTGGQQYTGEGVLHPDRQQESPDGARQRRARGQRRISLWREQFPSLPRGALVDFTDPDTGATAHYSVDATDRVETHMHTVILVPVGS